MHDSGESAPLYSKHHPPHNTTRTIKGNLYKQPPQIRHSLSASIPPPATPDTQRQLPHPTTYAHHTSSLPPKSLTIVIIILVRLLPELPHVLREGRTYRERWHHIQVLLVLVLLQYLGYFRHAGSWR